MKSDRTIKSRIPDKPENPFKVPSGYFDSLHERIIDSVREEENSRANKRGRIIRMRFYIAVAASIAGFALVASIVIQNVLHSRSSDDYYYNMALLEQVGILQDESVMTETYLKEENDNDFAWEEEAITYLASNEVDLDYILESN